jgi:hypothetical protein
MKLKICSRESNLKRIKSSWILTNAEFYEK